jgi:hypothetical protein
MASSSRNVKLGVCKLYLDGVDLGLTQGGVEVQVSTETHKVEVDQYGKSSINELVMGRTLVVKAPLAETTLNNMVATMPGATLISDGVAASGSITLASNPSAGNSATVAGQAFAFQAAKPSAIGQVKIGANVNESAANLAAAINLAVMRQDIGGIRATNVPGTAVVTLKVIDFGVLGNAVTLAASGAPVSVSGATLTGGVNETRARVEVGSGVGVDLLAIAKPLRLHPVGKADTDFSDDFLVYQAATPGALTFAYKLDAERIFNVEFTGYPDPVTGKLFAAGDLLA